MKQNWLRLPRAWFRYLRLLLYEFRWSLFAFIFIFGWGVMCFYHYHQPVSWGEATWHIYNLIFGEISFDYPSNRTLQITIFLVPFIGRVIIAEGLIRFTVVLFNRTQRSKEWQKMLASTCSNHIIVCGIGRVGFNTIKELVKLDAKQPIVIIQKILTKPYIKEVMKMKNIIVLEGDMKDREILLQAGIKKARSILMLTSDEIANLEAALEAKELNENVRIIIRLFSNTLAAKIQKHFNIEVAFSTSALSAPYIATATFNPNILHSFRVKGKLVCMIKLVIPKVSQLIGMNLSEIENRLDISVVSHSRGDNYDLHPHSEITLQFDDEIIIICPYENMEKIEQLSA